MGERAYLTLVGERQGILDGGVETPGREQSIEVLKVLHRLVVPRDPVHGKPKGNRSHTPVIVHLELGLAVAQLYESLRTNELFYAWQLVFYDELEDGTERRSTSIELFYASVTAMSLNESELRSGSGRVDVEVKFTYRGIEWRHPEASQVAADLWKTPYLS